MHGINSTKKKIVSDYEVLQVEYQISPLESKWDFSEKVSNPCQATL